MNKPLDQRRILIVEDEYMIAQDLRDMLERAGAVVIGPVPSTAKALRLVETEPALDGAILDVNLGSETSFVVAEALQLREIPFLFATGYNTSDIPDDWQRFPIEQKPLHADAVRRLLTPKPNLG